MQSDRRINSSEFDRSESDEEESEEESAAGLADAGGALDDADTRAAAGFVGAGLAAAPFGVGFLAAGASSSLEDDESLDGS